MSNTLLRADLITDDVDGSTRWRLRSRNGRLVAVSGRTFADGRAARADLRGLEPSINALRIDVQHAGSMQEWTWKLMADDGSSVVVAGHAYPRHGTCAAAANRFIRTLHYALICVDAGNRSERWAKRA